MINSELTTTMSAPVKGKSAATQSDATRACLYAVVDRFNTDEPFWGSFVPIADLTEIGNDRFRLTLQGRGVLIAVRGELLRGIGEAVRYVPQLVVGAIPAIDPSTPHGPEPEIMWHHVDCSVDVEGKFTTSNFRKAIEAAISDLA